MRTHHARAGGALSPPEGEAPVQPVIAQVLRQAALQVHQQQLREHAAPGEHVASKHDFFERYFRPGCSVVVAAALVLARY